MQEDKTNEINNTNLESAINQLRRLPSKTQVMVASLINRLAEAEGVSLLTEFRPPLKNIGPWFTKLRSERRSERTVEPCSYCAMRVLRLTHDPNSADVMGYLARRIEETSPSTAETERKTRTPRDSAPNQSSIGDGAVNLRLAGFPPDRCPLV